MYVHYFKAKHKENDLSSEQGWTRRILPTFGIYKLHVYISTMNLNISHIYVLQEMQQLPLE